MRKNKSVGFGFSALLAAVLIAGCGAVTQKAVDETDLSYRNVPLTEEGKQVPPPLQYSKNEPGSGKFLQRSFENAPPLIPHSVEGMLPITKANNACLTCHLPDVAKSVGATPVSPTHFYDFRPATSVDPSTGSIIKEGKPVGNTSDIKVVEKKLTKLNPARFNCSQCHVPQTNLKPLVKNTFEAEYRNSKATRKSNLLDILNEGVE